MAAPDQRSARGWRQAWPAGAGALLLSLLLFVQQSVEVREIQDKAYDFHLRTQPPRTRSDVAIVRITDHDYRALFGRRSPLDPDVLGRIIEAVAKGGPRAIGVDIDTYDAEFAALAAPDDPPVVWARSVCPDAGEPDAVRPCGVLGGRTQPEWTGLTALRPSADWSYRRYSRCAVVAGSAIPIFSTAVQAAAGLAADPCSARAGRAAREDATRERLIEYREGSPRFDIPASEVLRLADSPGFREDGPLRGKLVLVGGGYREARDRHITPLGPMVGVDIWAQILETEREGGGAVPPAWYWLIGVQLVAGSIVILIFYRSSLPRALALSAAAVPLLTLASSRVTFGTYWHAPYFLPTIGLILLWALVDRANQYRKAIVWDLYQSARLVVQSRDRASDDGDPPSAPPPAAPTAPAQQRAVPTPVPDLPPAAAFPVRASTAPAQQPAAPAQLSLPLDDPDASG